MTAGGLVFLGLCIIIVAFIGLMRATAGVEWEDRL